LRHNLPLVSLTLWRRSNFGR